MTVLYTDAKVISAYQTNYFDQYNRPVKGAEILLHAYAPSGDTADIHMSISHDGVINIRLGAMTVHQTVLGLLDD